MQICYQQSKRDCKDNLLKYLHILEIEDYKHSEKFIKKLLHEKMQSKLSQKNVISVFLDKELTDNQIEEVINI